MAWTSPFDARDDAKASFNESVYLPVNGNNGTATPASGKRNNVVAYVAMLAHHDNLNRARLVTLPEPTADESDHFVLLILD